jgi:hypothetical protein
MARTPGPKPAPAKMAPEPPQRDYVPSPPEAEALRGYLDLGGRATGRAGDG